MLVKIDSDIYNRYALTKQGQLVVYAARNKELYGTLHASLLFW